MRNSCAICKLQKDKGSNELGFSNKPVEEQKKEVEDAAVAMITSMSDLLDTESMGAISNMSKLDPSNAMKSNPIAAAFWGIESKDSKATLKALKAQTEIEAEFEQEAGIYEWNSQRRDWDKKSATGQIIFKFPSKPSSTTNDAELAVTEFKAAANSLLDEEVPTSLKAHLKVGGKELVTYTFTGIYDKEGLPQDIKSVLSIENIFSVNYSTAVSRNNAKFEYSFNKKSDVVFGYSAEANGDFSDKNIDAIENLEDDRDFSVVGKLVSTVKFQYQMLNIVVVLDANTKALADEASKIVENEDEDAAMAALNKHVKLYVGYHKGDKIADSEFVMERNELNAYFIFADKSKVEASAYLEDSMEKAQSEMLDLLEKASEMFNMAFTDPV
jgi:hypothetical protein